MHYGHNQAAYLGRLNQAAAQSTYLDYIAHSPTQTASLALEQTILLIQDAALCRFYAPAAICAMTMLILLIQADPALF